MAMKASFVEGCLKPHTWIARHALLPCVAFDGVVLPPPGLAAPDHLMQAAPSSAMFEALARLQADRASQALDAAIVAASKPKLERHDSPKFETWSQASTASDLEQSTPRGEERIPVRFCVSDHYDMMQRKAVSDLTGRHPCFQPGQPAYVNPHQHVVGSFAPSRTAYRAKPTA
ncbi:unnamed protein product [Effrenium voratum]|nr:unnamed protein product [Effrenium voratum]